MTNSEIIKKIVSLRKNYEKVEYIMEQTGLSDYAVRKILRKQLGRSYYKYKWNGNREYNIDLAESIVSLRKQYKSIKDISTCVGISQSAVTSVLEIELGDDYDAYCCKNDPLSPETISRVINMGKKGYSIKFIIEKLKTSRFLTTKVLKENLQYKIVPKQVPRIIDSSKRLLSFSELFDTVTSEAPLHEVNMLKEVAIDFMRDLRNKITKRTQLRSEHRLGPFTLYIFLKLNHVKCTTGQYLSLVGFSKKEFTNTMKILLPLCPQYQARDRKAIVTQNIKLVKEHFSLISEFLPTALELLDIFWLKIRNTTEDIITSFICILTMIKLNIVSISYNTLCTFIGVRLGSLYNNMRTTFQFTDFKGIQYESNYP